MKIAKILAGITMGVFLSAACIGTAIAVPYFDIDFYGGDSGLLQGEYDTDTNLNLPDGQSVLVDILISGLEPGNGLIGWSLLLNYGDNLNASNIQVNRSDWPLYIDQPDIQAGFLSAQGLAFFGTNVAGDDLLLFSFDITVLNSTDACVLTLWDFDQGGVLDDVMTNQFYVLDGNALPVDLATLNQASAVPLPGSIFFLFISLTGLITLRKK
ncbi:MAG: hypothetical protein KKE62_13430 [Proteobacteria bacterium]|nr:hypothetical protein [Pseudomonadota bacterium]MBU1389823.1 hypothetical protein [Pseudomonadota bacterium]MBU1543832.1 hypothetical protein [Pseudomonadota bacterium]MBU2430398.1 hypothetical protein [Pseudomonadota bacterium]MBU2482365.1 hypothetical protein [Pseudomonadota bacterium]